MTNRAYRFTVAEVNEEVTVVERFVDSDGEFFVLAGTSQEITNFKHLCNNTMVTRQMAMEQAAIIRINRTYGR